MTTPLKAIIEPGERSIWRETIANVIAIATSASGAFCATSDWSVRPFSQSGSAIRKMTRSPPVMMRRNHVSR
jgi:hypothetical protein